jgi:ubiquinone/menaquinone biosynthesis C-methylase UbiE
MDYDAINARYKVFYRDIQYKNANGKFSSYFHKRIEKDLPFGKFERVLEVGAGSAEHFRYVSHDFQEYVISDLVHPELETDLAMLISDLRVKGKEIRIEIQDVQDLKYPDSHFDRVVITCLLHHVSDPMRALNEVRRVVKCGGLVSIYVPSDPGLIYRLAQTLFSTISFRDFFSDQEIKFLRATEHRNHVGSLIGMIIGVFEFDKVSQRSFPKYTPGWNTRIFDVFQIEVEK